MKVTTVQIEGRDYDVLLSPENGLFEIAGLPADIKGEIKHWFSSLAELRSAIQSLEQTMKAKADLKIPFTLVKDGALYDYVVRRRHAVRHGDILVYDKNGQKDVLGLYTLHNALRPLTTKQRSELEAALAAKQEAEARLNDLISLYKIDLAGQIKTAETK